MMKFSRRGLLSRKKFLKLGISATVSLTVLSLSKLQALSYLIYPFRQKPEQNVKIQSRKFTVVGKNSLKQRAKAKGLIYGAFPQAYAQAFGRDRKLQSILVRDCATITVGAYWSSIRPTVKTFNFTESDYFVKFGAANQLILRGHPLVWHESVPQWFSSTLTSANAEQILTQHIQTVVNRYAGKINSWDVVNEAIDVGDGRADGMRKTPWLEFLGPDYIDLAFKLAAKADPQAKLVYNDFGIEYDLEGDDRKRAAVLNLLQRLKSNGVPIYALGIQSHLGSNIAKFNREKFRKFLSDVASLGLKIMISELDVTDEDLPKDPKQRDRIIAATYEDYLTVALAQKAVISVTTWGLSDRYTWLSDHKPRQDKAAVRPLPFDREMKPKLAWNAIARAFDRAPKR